MLSMYLTVARLAGQRFVTSWPVALSLIAYVLILIPAMIIAGQMGSIIGGLFFSLVMAACLSSYLELISQALSGLRFRFDWDGFKRSFLARFGDVISVLFAFWILGFVTSLLAQGDQARAVTAIVGFAMAFFFNVTPELLYQGNSRSFALLAESARFVTEHPVAWFLPNLLFAAAALGASGKLDVQHPVELLLAFGNLFSSAQGVAQIFVGLPIWAIPIALLALHFVMLFRGLLFQELASGGNNARMRAFRAKMR